MIPRDVSDWWLPWSRVLLPRSRGMLHVFDWVMCPWIIKISRIRCFCQTRSTFTLFCHIVLLLCCVLAPIHFNLFLSCDGSLYFGLMSTVHILCHPPILDWPKLTFEFPADWWQLRFMTKSRLTLVKSADLGLWLIKPCACCCSIIFRALFTQVL